MNLSFSENINGAPSFFVQKILHGLYNLSVDYLGFEFTPEDIIKLADNYDTRLITESRMDEIRYLDTVAPKIHTFREDKGNRWKVGNKIHFVINNRSPKRYQFAPLLWCCCVEKIKIRWLESAMGRIVEIYLNDILYGRSLLSKVNSHGFISELAKNDGFSDAESFCEYFKKGFNGKLIHWVMPEGYKLPIADITIDADIGALKTQPI